MKPTRYLFLTSQFLLLLLVACNFQVSQAPTQIFDNAAPNLTLTAYYSVGTPIVQPATPTFQLPVFSTATQNIPAVTATSAPIILPTSTFPPPPPTATNTQVPVPTNPPTATPILERGRGKVIATYLSPAPAIDAENTDWRIDSYSAHENVFGKENWYGNKDSSADFMVGWDYNYLYITAKVYEDLYIQNASGLDLYKGDSLEILFDAKLGADFTSDSLSGDDFQLGISPGAPYPGNNPNAYLWFPSDQAGSRSKVKIAAKWTEQSYVIEIAIPWDTFGVTPEAGQRYGFAFSVSDNDTEGQNVQQSLISNITTRRLTNPTTWGDLYLKK